MRKLILCLSHDTRNLVESIGAMTQNTRVNCFEVLLAKQIGSRLLFG
ncbi:MAG TPA: hypothetical protein VFV96_10630 [Verrucomicrobiae bacterium]|nr:hypothetical protein [Verrucomicrobiae bacterium]